MRAFLKKIIAESAKIIKLRTAHFPVVKGAERLLFLMISGMIVMTRMRNAPLDFREK